jgi:pyruvate,orthophosphate dikinase
MVYGNMGDDSGTGVAFTRNPATGEKKVFGEYLINAQGEDVVAGIRTPEPIDRLKTDMPEIYGQFINTRAVLESHFKDMQDIEFTIENGKLYFLQTRTGKRTAAAALQAAVDMVDEGLIDKNTAILRIDAASLTQLMYPAFTEKAVKAADALVRDCLPLRERQRARCIFRPKRLKKHAEDGEDVILVRKETSRKI